MKRVMTSALALLGCLSVYAQDLPNIVPPSPEAAALAKFTDIPVSHYTGLPNISIPFYTISVKGVQIPIQLSYHARGVQVSQMASRTGLGWSLQYGGSLSRQIRGKADEYSYNGYLANKNDFKNFPLNEATRVIVNNKEIFDPSYDFYPDQFSFSVGGSSGKFIFNYEDGQPVIQSFGDIKISYTRKNSNVTGRIESFQIIDPQGNTYYFGVSKDGLRKGQDYQVSTDKRINYNGTVVNGTITNPANFLSSWKLMDIETPFGDLISYHYEISNESYWRKSYDMHTSQGVTNGVGDFSNITTMYTKAAKVTNHEAHLKKITFNKGSIEFEKSSTLREDYNGYALDKVLVKDTNGVTVKSYNLNYTYTTSTDQSNMNWFFKNKPLFAKFLKRMFLTSIEEVGSDGQTENPYVFTYDSEVLPSVFSTKQDYWGYYNAADNGPFLRIFNYGFYTPDRRVNISKSEAGILKQITYPTGGITKFTYEHNKGIAPLFFGEVKTPAINPGSISQVTIKLTKADFTYNSATGTYAPKTITFPKTGVHYQIDCVHPLDINGNPNIPSCIFNFTMDGTPLGQFSSGQFSTYNDTSKTFAISTSNISGVDPNLHLNPHYDFKIILKYNISSHQSGVLYGAGKRIQKITYITERDTVHREYEYLITALNNSIGSGAIIGLPEYINLYQNNHYSIPVLTHYYSSNSAYGSFQPNSIGYSSVTEYLGTKNNNEGKTEYTFSNLSDSGGDYWEFPYHPPTDNEWLRGKLISSKTYKNTNNTYTIQRESHNKYLYANTTTNMDMSGVGLVNFGFPFTPESTQNCWSCDVATPGYQKNDTLFKLPLFMRQRNYGGINGALGYRLYHLTGGTQDLLETTQIEYNAAGTFENKTTYTYDYNTNYQVKSTTALNSNDELLKTQYTYPSNGSTLHTQNRLTPPINTKVYNGITALSEQNTVYSTFNGFYLPSKIQTSKGNQSLEDRVVYHDYDDKGNPLEVSKKDGTRIVYLWGYNKTKPIAKIENATYSEVSAYVANLQTLSDADNDRSIGTTGNEGALRAALNNLRSVAALSDAMITTFTYDPLVGVTSITDPRGNVIYYEYDTFNRLKVVRDADGKIVQQTEYNYKN